MTTETVQRIVARLSPLGREGARRVLRAIWAKFTPLEQVAMGLKGGLFTAVEIADLEQRWGVRFPWAVPAKEPPAPVTP